MTSSLWTPDELVAATGSTLHGTPQNITGIEFDSRLVKPGDIFIALKDDSAGGNDGHAYVNKAFNNGAALTIASQPGDGPRLLVRDTMQALYDLATFARTRAPAKRAVVTGSVGKTGTTRAILAGLQLAGAAHGPVGSFNNHIGLPLTLARMPRITERAVFEIGMNHAGEITPLSQLVQPHVALITTVGAVHTENFSDGEAGVARAKAEIFHGMQPGGVAVLNNDNQWFDFLSSEARNAGLGVRSFGTAPNSTLRLQRSEQVDGGVKIEAGDLDFTVPQRGAHWALNSLGILLVLESMDVPRDLAIKSLENFYPLAGRGESHLLPVAGGTITLIDESYNANPISMRATLIYLGTQQSRRIAVLTDMLELGPQEAEWHRELRIAIEDNGIDLVFCAGPLMQNLWDALPDSRRGAYAASAAGLVAPLLAALQPGDTVLVKGSKGSKAASLTDALLTLKQAA